ncbi:Bifunctional adenosylcobalamin biosynthesis protein CobP [Sulfitobacter sp. THAF37]|uniref:bifunctional adenosylcobinamide kinase/adenosylcobinamide-phosphate guanylyltransferase n=1 Tax=Sulfitobacter sp. THAF37 TaxID=2587855 RepID=UPI0012692888|nr:bifunctional adenosylcobinamide kinase/adenosylcobinamide-phosphate guanylyltransferase [Sulfitobacter sp. THAF37]QFT58645.1 Bifunctional adenosylcobalamin biosynthesis protein CobP [Sulfitobacter sp. THAF37]
MLTQTALVLGGAASGKSGWAEAMLEKGGRPMVYLATSRVFDDEVAQKVAIHRKRRDARWRTVDAPLDLGPALADVTAQDHVLIDCATMWLTNHMMDGNDIAAAQDALLAALRTCAAPWVIVSNEVGHGIVPDNALARRFREAQGRLNILLAQEAALVVQVTAGLPLALKGQLP